MRRRRRRRNRLQKQRGVEEFKKTEKKDSKTQRKRTNIRTRGMQSFKKIPDAIRHPQA